MSSPAATAATKAPTLQVGSRVEVPEKGRGTVRFMGAVKFSSKDNWVGIELDSPNGNHDGAVKGVRYFKCTMNHGLFVTKDKVLLLKKVTKPAAGSLAVKSPTASTSPSPTPSAPSSPRGEPAAASPAATSAPAPADTPAPTPTPAAVAPASPAPTAEEPPAQADKPAEEPKRAAPVSEAKEKGVKEEEEEPLPKPSLPATRLPTTTSSPASTATTPSSTPTSVSTAPSTPSTPSTSTATTSSRPPAQAASPLSAESSGLFTTLQELSEFKKEAQQKMKALQKSLDDVTKEKDALAKELEREKKDRDKQIGRMQKKWEDEKEQLQKAWEEEKEEITDEMANLSETLEMMTLDKELAEEKAESLEKKLERIKIKFKLDDLDDGDEDLDDDDEDDEGSDDDEGRQAKAKSAGDDSEKAALNLQIQRLTDALMKLKDLSVMEKKENEKKIRQLERENDGIPVLEDKIAKLKDDLKKANEKIEQLKEQLDVALEAEDMVEELSEKKLELEEQVQELQQTIEDLEQLQQVSEELEENHAEVEKQLRTTLYKKEIQYLESLTKIKNQQVEIEDRDKTIDQFREKVNSLQQHIKHYEEKEEDLATEARQLSTKSQALLDQNIQLKTQVTKVAAMGLERELFRLDVLQARKQLTFIQAFTPEAILARDNEPLMLLLTLDRLVFKAKLLMGHLQSYYKLDQLSFNLINDVELQYATDELLFAWELYWGVSKVRFYTSGLRKVLSDPTVCPPELFLRTGRAMLDLLPYEGAMDFILQLIKKEELNHNYDINIFRSFQDKMNGLINQYVLEEGAALSDSSDTIPLRRQLSARGTGVAALCPPVWKSLRHEVDGILVVENLFLVLYSQLRTTLKAVEGTPSTTEAGAASAAQLAIPIRLVRDAIEVCRKLQKHLQEKPSLPRHYATKLERNLGATFGAISGAIEVLRQLFAHLRNTAASMDSAGKDKDKDKEIRAVLPKLVAKYIVAPKDKQVADDEDLKDLSDSTAASEGHAEHQEKGAEEKQKEVDTQEQEQQADGVEEKGAEWKWLATLLEETYSSIVGVSDKILNSSNFIKPDAAINITPLSTPSAALASSSSSSTPIAGTPAGKPFVSLTPASGASAPTSPSLRAGDAQPAWKQRADVVRAELAAAASVRSKLLEAEVLAQERLVKLNLQENEIKEHISRYNVLQMHLTALQKKEAELSEKMEKQTAEHVSQEKMYEDAMETIQKENEQLRQQIRSLRSEIRHLENAKKEAEEQRSELPSLEFVSAEIKALKRALVLLRRQNSELLAREGQKRLRALLPPLADAEARCAAYFSPLQQQLQQDQDAEEDHPSVATGGQAKKSTTITTLHKHNAEAQQFLHQLQSFKAASKVIDLTLTGVEAPSQQWANKRLTAVKLETQCKQVKEKLGAALLDSPSQAKITSDFASFPSAQLTKTLAQAQPVGKLALPLMSASPAGEQQQTKEVRTQMQDLLGRLRHGTSNRTRVVLNSRQLQHVHSLVL